MKCYKTFVPKHDPQPLSEDADFQPVSAKILGSSIVDGRYNGVCDGSAGLLHGQYDNDTSLSVDPLCDFGTDPFGMRSSAVPQSTSSSTDSE